LASTHLTAEDIFTGNVSEQDLDDRVIAELVEERRRDLEAAASMQEVDFLEQRCYGCGERMIVGKGDTLYGGNWYHGSCWASRKPVTPPAIVKAGSRGPIP
jgi:hypothetical protein